MDIWLAISIRSPPESITNKLRLQFCFVSFDYEDDFKFSFVSLYCPNKFSFIFVLFFISFILNSNSSPFCRLCKDQNKNLTDPDIQSISDIKEDQIIRGYVTSITDLGVFVR